jgi:hypothetical protein
MKEKAEQFVEGFVEQTFQRAFCQTIQHTGKSLLIVSEE